ncbi:phage tail protein [Aeromonas hydrophila]|uniref:phage tail protein n=1 Tax=Aeromonas hydrophila TaxID=644 RepID=UPI001116EAFA|nr:phage tail protein [Aeromonas hydrophila]TNH89159.1 phage tail protein [Aeromonas hydrophila]TNI00943.1 phage tail protein [Aeromonas hydrophila]TNI98004.1 phage tail protein [Aeromonas hydrophila]
MSAIYFAIPTNAGQAKIANAIALGVPLKITHMAVGDGNGQPVTPNAAQTALVRERRRAPINTLFQDPTNQSQLVAEQIIPENVGDWWIREAGIFAEDGTLIAIANTPDTYKPLLSSGAGRTQVIRIVLIVSDTSAVELKIDPAVVLATRKYVDDLMAAHKESRDHQAGNQTEKGMLRLATQSEALAGLLDSVAVAPREMKAAMESLLDIVAPIGVPIPWVAETPPNSRFLIAQGQSFDKVAYPKLGSLWPNGVIPFDMRGEFPRGWDNGRGVDVGRQLLSAQAHSIEHHSHALPTSSEGSSTTSGQWGVDDQYWKQIDRFNEQPTTGGWAGTASWPGQTPGMARGNFQGETRSRNIAFNYIVRAA